VYRVGRPVGVKIGAWLDQLKSILVYDTAAILTEIAWHAEKNPGWLELTKT
jgi:hypothetical protein